MKYTAALLPAILCPVAVSAAPAAPEHDTHQLIAEDIVRLLEQTDLALASCTDEQSVKAALPRLRELSEEAGAIAMRQATIAPPIIQDDIAAAALADRFAALWQSIRRHVDRLAKAGLYSDDLQSILLIRPTVAPAPAAAH